MKIGFVHIPRTGGTYLEGLLSIMGPEKFINFFGTPNDQIINKLGLIEYIERDKGRQDHLMSLANWPSAQLFSGHFSLNIKKFLPDDYDYQFITILRNPLNRVISFSKKITSSRNFKKALTEDGNINSDLFWYNLQKYIEEKKTNGLMIHERHGFSNYMTKAIAGIDLAKDIDVDESIYEQAVFNLKNMLYIGKFEDYTETVKSFFSILNIPERPMQTRPENTHKVPETVKQFLTHINNYDFKLYKEAFPNE